MIPLIEDRFEVLDVDPEGSKYRKVSRIVAKSIKHSLRMVLEMNSEAYRMGKGEWFRMALSATFPRELDRDFEGATDNWDCILRGKCFKVDQGTKDIEVFVSFGGLITSIQGGPLLRGVELDKCVYLLLSRELPSVECTKTV